MGGSSGGASGGSSGGNLGMGSTRSPGGTGYGGDLGGYGTAGEMSGGAGGAGMAGYGGGGIAGVRDSGWGGPGGSAGRQPPGGTVSVGSDGRLNYSAPTAQQFRSGLASDPRAIAAGVKSFSTPIPTTTAPLLAPAQPAPIIGARKNNIPMANPRPGVSNYSQNTRPGVDPGMTHSPYGGYGGYGAYGGADPSIGNQGYGLNGQPRSGTTGPMSGKPGSLGGTGRGGRVGGGIHGGGTRSF